MKKSLRNSLLLAVLVLTSCTPKVVKETSGESKDEDSIESYLLKSNKVLVISEERSFNMVGSSFLKGIKKLKPSKNIQTPKAAPDNQIGRKPGTPLTKNEIDSLKAPVKKIDDIAANQIRADISNVESYIGIKRLKFLDTAKEYDLVNRVTNKKYIFRHKGKSVEYSADHYADLNMLYRDVTDYFSYNIPLIIKIPNAIDSIPRFKNRFYIKVLDNGSLYLKPKPTSTRITDDGILAKKYGAYEYIGEFNDNGRLIKGKRIESGYTTSEGIFSAKGMGDLEYGLESSARRAKLSYGDRHIIVNKDRLFTYIDKDEVIKIEVDIYKNIISYESDGILKIPSEGQINKLHAEWNKAYKEIDSKGVKIKRLEPPDFKFTDVSRKRITSEQIEKEIVKAKGIIRRIEYLQMVASNAPFGKALFDKPAVEIFDLLNKKDFSNSAIGKVLFDGDADQIEKFSIALQFAHKSGNLKINMETGKFDLDAFVSDSSRFHSALIKKKANLRLLVNEWSRWNR